MSGRETGARVPRPEQKKIFQAYLDGGSFAAIGRKFGRDRKVVQAICNRLQNSSGDQWKAERVQTGLPDPRPAGELCDEATRALEDFGYFRARYFGRVPTPWQEAAAYRVLELLSSPRKEFVVVNCPPGSGKSTLFTHDIAAWLACRDRSIRALIGSRTFRQARWYTGRLRRTFERAATLPADEEEVAAGRALPPESSLVTDFGRFRPQTQFTTDVWRAEEFVIAQPGDLSISEKEASFAAYGMDSGFLGGRFKLVIWDDLVDRKSLNSRDAMAALVEVYENEAETRLEPGGLLILQGQRMGAEDLYRHCLDQLAGEVDVEEWDDHAADAPRKYHHVVYRAHYPENCSEGSHKRDAPCWAPDDPASGCLLDPRRLPWRELATLQANRMERFRVLYQQEDVDPASILVPRIWIDGGRDVETGEEFPGCWDKGRSIAEIPKGLIPPLYSVATADPSPTMYWAIQWWAFHPATEQRFLLDQIRAKMDAPEFLDFDYANGVHTGVMEEWQERSRDMGLPIERWIVEANAAQRFLLQYDHVRTWQAKHKVAIVPHQTQRNKTDDKYGVQSIAPHYRFGRIRLPSGGNHHGDSSRLAALQLVDEVTRYPEGRYDDCVMAHWFLEWHLPRLYPARKGKARRLPRPSWVSGESSRSAPGRSPVAAQR